MKIDAEYKDCYMKRIVHVNLGYGIQPFNIALFKILNAKKL